jgi:DNA-binding IclR family transcriptional regulator
MQDPIPASSADAPRGGVQSIARAGAVLRALEAKPAGLPLGELSAAVGLPKSTVHRLVAALAAEELVGTAPDGRIRLGGGLTRLGAASRESLGAELMPVLRQLRSELDETVDLAVLDGTVARFVEQIAAPHRLRAVSAVGAAFPLHCTANGKALLAALPDEHALSLLPARLDRFTPNTIVTRKALLAELSEVRSDGLAYDREEHTEGICAIGAAVSDAAGGPVAAISVPVPTPRFQGQETRYADSLRSAAGAATQLLSGEPG